MQFFGTNFTITVGELRLRLMLSLDDADDESPDRQIRAIPDTPAANRTFGR